MNRSALLFVLVTLVPGIGHAGANVPAGAELVDTTELQQPLALESPPSECVMSEMERELLSRIAGDQRQQREQIRCEPQLQRFAHERAQDMVDRGYFGHLTPERIGPNALLRESGYPLPSVYGGMIANSVEAIVAGYGDVERVWRELLDSPSHRRHLLGEVEFFRQQDEIGIAHVHAADSEYEDYWVIVIARKSRAGEPRFVCSPEPAFCFKFGEESGQ